MTVSIDLYSDTVSQPSPGMRQAMADAPVGDAPTKQDVLTNRLVGMTAELLGKEDAIFLPSGTMCNAISYRAHCRPGDEAIADRTCHAIHSEAGGAAALSGVLFATVNGRRGVYSGADVAGAVRQPASPIRPRSRLIVVEQTAMRAGGSVWPLAAIEEVSETARRYNLAVHMDGARLLNAVARTGIPANVFAATCDSVWIDFSKGLGAPVGAALAGSKPFIDECWRWATQFGGAMRKTGMLAAACIYALEHNTARLAEDNDNAMFFATELAGIKGITVDLDTVESNVVIFDVSGTGFDPDEIHLRLLDHGIRIGVFGATVMRALTHMDVSRPQLEWVLSVLRSVLAEQPERATPGALSRRTC